MAQLFTPGAQFPSRKHLYAARNDFHCTTGFKLKLVVLNWNNEHVMLLCHQANAKPNWGRHTSIWTVSARIRSTSRFAIKIYSTNCGFCFQNPARARQSPKGSRLDSIVFGVPQGTQPTVYREPIEESYDFGTELESFCKLECYLERLVQAIPGCQLLFQRMRREIPEGFVCGIVRC